MPKAAVRIFHRILTAWILGAALGLAQQQPTQALSPDRVTFYTEPNFKGEALTVEAGATVETLDRLTRTATQRPWTYAISSVRVEGSARATAFTGAGYSGERLEISRDIADLYSVRRTGEPGATWDRAIASVTVTGPQRAVVTAPPPVSRYPEPRYPEQRYPEQRYPEQRYPEQPTTVYVVPTPAPPPPPPPVIVREVRPRMDRRTAEQIVHRAFREVLNRPADAEGMRTYRDRVMMEGWSERQVIEQLQRSSEARGVNADEAIRQAYREVLGRDPDASGLASYRAKWRDGWTQGMIRDDLRRSQEGRQSHVKNAIARAYRELLGREPDAAGYANYERLMRDRGMSEREMRESIMNGDEYRQRQGGKKR